MSRPRALVTGAARRVGAAIAVELARAGFDVGIHCRRSAPDQVLAACRAAGADAWSVTADLATGDGVARVADATLSRWDGLHVLVHNASIFEPTAFEDVTADILDHMMAVHARAPLLLSRALLPLLRAADPGPLRLPAGQHGLVVHLCDIGAERPARGYTAYSMSKAALVMLVRSMAVELAPAVRSIGVSPGQVAWPDDYDDERRGRLVRRIPLGRVGAPEDVARLVRFAACEGHYLNGVVLPVDGGLSTRY
jgi:pteridine reductase